MSIASLAECCDFSDVDIEGSFTITSVNDVLRLSYDEGAVTDVDCDDGTYEGSELAAELQTQIDAAFTISSTVTYSSTTYKFTIDVGGGHTVAYTHSGSDAGLTFGFNADHADAQTITSNKAVPGNPADTIQTLLNLVDAWCEKHCHRAFESATYIELRNGNSKTFLYLKQKPITAITQLSVGRVNAIKVRNTGTDVTSAYATVSSTGVDLVIVGGANAGSDTVDWATYTTLTAVVDQINTLSAKGWVATLYDADDASILSTQLIESMAKYCGGRGNTVAADVYLEMPSAPVGDFRYNDVAGQLYLPSGFTKGYRNIYIGYTAGYSSSTMPDDLKGSILIAVKHLYDRRDEDGFGKESIAVAGLTQRYVELLPSEVIRIWDSHKKKVMF